MANTVKKLSRGYGYSYSDLSTIHAELEKEKITYFQETKFEPAAGGDYVYTTIVQDGEKSEPRRGCKIIYDAQGAKTNPAQAQGSGVTYARRYSLLMALGWATEDDDGNSAGANQPQAKQQAVRAPSEKQKILITQLMVGQGYAKTQIDQTLAKLKTSEEVSSAIKKLSGRNGEK